MKVSGSGEEEPGDTHAPSGRGEEERPPRESRHAAGDAAASPIRNLGKAEGSEQEWAGEAVRDEVDEGEEEARRAAVRGELDALQFPSRCGGGDGGRLLLYEYSQAFGCCSVRGIQPQMGQVGNAQAVNSQPHTSQDTAATHKPSQHSTNEDKLPTHQARTLLRCGRREGRAGRARTRANFEACSFQRLNLAPAYSSTSSGDCRKLPVRDAACPLAAHGPHKETLART